MGLNKVDTNLGYEQNKVMCVCCGWGGEAFLPCPYGSEPRRKNAMCLQCGSLERHRLCFLYLKSVIPIDRTLKVLHISPETSLAHIPHVFVLDHK
mgnify:CR=1 FL=1